MIPIEGCARSATLPGISWRGTCAKLKPLPIQASLTSVQFRALKSALAATDSTEKVQMIVCSLSIVHYCDDPYSLGFSAISGFLLKLPCSRSAGTWWIWRLMVASQILVSTNTFPQTKLLSVTPERGKKMIPEVPPAPQRRRLRVNRCHMNPAGSAFPAALTQLLWADGTPARCVEVELLCGGERPTFTGRYTGMAERDTKHGVESSLIHLGGGASVKLDLMKINQDTRGDGQVIGDFSKRESGFDRYSFGKCYPVSSDVRTCFAII